jgi:arginyl-tRNA synthetase
LSEDGSIDRALNALKAADHAYLKDGALWFKSTDTATRRTASWCATTALKTYFASDIAYVFNKLERGFEHLLYVWGADHHGYIVRLRAGLTALGGPPNASRCAGPVRFAVPRRREGADVDALRRVRHLARSAPEVGNDAARLFYVMRSNDQHLDFDLELAKARSNDNPVYYIQYAHARVAQRDAAAQGARLEHDAARHRALGAASEPQEPQALIKRLCLYPEIVEQCAVQRAPHTLVHYLRDLANDFHTNYSAHQFIVEDAALRDARLALARRRADRDSQRTGLLGVSAPDTM